MSASISILCSVAIGAAGCLSLASLARNLRAIPSQWRALRAALQDIDQ